MTLAADRSRTEAAETSGISTMQTAARARIGSLRRTAVGTACAVLAIVALACVWLTARPATALASSAAPPRLTVLVLAPYLTFDDLSPAETPALWKLAEDGALGAINARTSDPGQPNTVSGALTISAGRWASIEPGTPATAADIATLQEAQTGSLTRPVLGSLGEAVSTADGQTAAISSGRIRVGAKGPVQRPAELVATDTTGNVDWSAAAGFSSTTTYRPRRSRARVSLGFDQVTRLALRAIESSGAPRLLVLDIPPLAAASETTLAPSAAKAEHTSAVRELGESVAVLRANVPAGTTLMVVTPATSKGWYQDPNLGVVIAWGDGFRGELTSASTHRPGLVTTLDVAPTVLESLDIDWPPAMVGAPITSRAVSTPLAQRVKALAAENASLGVIDQLREAWFIPAFVGLALLVVAFGCWVVLSGARGGVRLAATVAALFAAAIPPSAWLAQFVVRQPQSIGSALTALGVTALLVLAALLGVRWWAAQRRGDGCSGGLCAALTVSALTTLVILADQWTGSPLRTGLFSYSVRSGWRYYGIGNEGSALLVGASIVATALAVDALAGSRWQVLARRWAMPVVGVVVLVTAAGPFAGANAGVAVWGVVAFAIAWAAMNRIKLRLRTVALTLALVAAAVAIFAAMDLKTAAGGTTHLARFAGGILSGDMAATRELVSRKLANNLGLFLATRYTLLFLGLVLVWIPLRPRSTSRFRAALATAPALLGALLGVFVGGLVALVTEDSSSVMPALMWFAALVPTLVVALGSDSSAN
jgi:hypothetical protein